MDSDYISEIFSQVGVQDLTAGPVIALALAVLLLFASGFISASEVAFFSLKPNDINRIKEGNHPADSVILDLLNNSEFLLATILIANNFVNVAEGHADNGICCSIIYSYAFSVLQCGAREYYIRNISLQFVRRCWA